MYDTIMSTMTDMGTLSMSTFNKLKKKKFEQARNTHRFFLEQFLIFMLYFRAKNEKNGNMEINNSFIGNILTFANLVKKEREDYFDLLKTVFGMINGNKNQFEIITFLQEQITEDQEHATEQQRYLKILADCPFISNKTIKSKYCAFMLFYMKKSAQHLAVARLIEVGEKNLTDEYLDTLFNDATHFCQHSNKEVFDEDMFDSQIIDLMMESSLLMNEQTYVDKDPKILTNDIKKLYNRDFRGNVHTDDTHKTLSIPNWLINQMDEFGYGKSIGELARNVMSYNSEPDSKDDDGLSEKSKLKVISDIYTSCKSSLFQKLNQVPKIIASLIEFDLRSQNIEEMLYQYEKQLAHLKDRVELQENKNLHPLLYMTIIKKSKKEEKKELMDFIEKNENITDEVRDDAFRLIDEGDDETNRFYMDATTALISYFYYNIDFMNGWKDKSKSMPHRFRSGDKVINEYFYRREKCIFHIIENQSKQIKNSNILLPEKMISNPIILPIMIV